MMKRERAFWGALVDKDPKEDGYEDDPNKSFPKISPFECHPMLGPPA
jgi:hypothetical protein